jgi:hypothetical protein
VTGHQPSPLEQALRGKLDQFVAAGRLTETGAAAVLPGYEHPELQLWVHDPADQPPDLDAVRVTGEQWRTEQAQQAAEAQEHYWATRTGDTQAYYLDTTTTAEDADHTAAEDADADGLDDGT